MIPHDKSIVVIQLSICLHGSNLVQTMYDKKYVKTKTSYA